jgi:hypothetical protein
MMNVEDKGRTYSVAFLGSMTPNAGVPLANNPRHKNVIDGTRLGFTRLKAEKPPDIVLLAHAQSAFAGKIEQMKAGATPHPLLNTYDWNKQVANAEAGFEKRVAEEKAGGSR